MEQQLFLLLFGHLWPLFKPMTIVNDDARVVNQLEASLTDDARVVIYVRHMFIVQATDFHKKSLDIRFGPYPFVL